MFTERAINKFLKELEKLNWRSVNEEVCPNRKFELYSNIFNKMFQNIFPVKTCKKNNKAEKSLHITPGFKKCIREKHSLEGLAVK